MSDKRRALVIGCGRIAGGYNSGLGDPIVLTHALAYARHSDYLLAACVEPDEPSRHAFMKKWDIPSGYSSLDEALAEEKFDIASVCSPTGTHLAALMRLAESAVTAVFAEKPLDGDATAALTTAARFAAKGVPVAVNFTRRFDPAMHVLRSEIAQARYGALRGIRGWYCRGILNNGSHMLDLVRFLTGMSPKLHSTGLALDDGVPGDPTVSASLEIGHSQFELVGCDGRDYARFELELAFARGIVSLEEGGRSIRRRPIEAGPFAGTNSPARGVWESTGYGESMLRALDELKDWSRTRKLSSDIETASPSIALADQIRRAASTPVVVAVSDGDGRAA
jgi:predicted dehydrogenase